jgi:myo-inositol 2-dehydrogenase/D-chiro-inositol 1-dehydrogenase
MGKRHALNFLERTPRAQLVAASSPDDAELEWAKVHLAPFGVKLYKNYDDMLKHEGLEAVVVASATAVHAEQAIKAIDANKHVLCEKPLSTSVEIVCPLHVLFCPCNLQVTLTQPVANRLRRSRPKA